MAGDPVREYMIRADGLRFHIVEWGDPRDPTVLLLHGRSANATSWHRFAVGLSDRHRVVAFDQRGHGLSEWPGWYSDRLLVADVMRVVDAVPIDRFTLVGHSMGAAVAWEFAARHPGKVSCLVLMDASPDPPGSNEAYQGVPQTPPGLSSPDEIITWARAQGWTEGLDEDDLHRWLTRHAYRSPGGGWVRGFDEAALELAYASGRMWQGAYADWRDVDRITCPTLVVIGQHGDVGEELGLQLAEGLRLGSLAVIPGTGHLLIWQDVDATLGAVRPFLDAHTRPAA